MKIVVSEVTLSFEWRGQVTQHSTQTLPHLLAHKISYNESSDNHLFLRIFYGALLVSCSLRYSVCIALEILASQIRD